MSKRLIERALAGELNHHLNVEQAVEIDESNLESLPRDNSRNGYSKKTIQSNHGEMDLAIPRDRQGEFEPILVPKHQRRLAGLDEKILVLYAHGVNVSTSLISEVADSVSDEVKVWQVRPLEEVCPILYLDALYVNIKVSGRASKRAV